MSDKEDSIWVEFLRVDWILITCFRTEGMLRIMIMKKEL